MLGIGPEVTSAELEKAQVRRSFALLKGSDAQKAELRAAYDALAAELRRREAEARVTRPPMRPASAPPVHRVPLPVPAPREESELFNLFSFDSWLVNTVALPATIAAAWLANASPFAFFLAGYHVWMHELGHATFAWMSGHRALPLPIGWTNIDTEKSLFVYCGVLFLFGVMAWAGWRERKIWAILAPAALVPVQFYLTWVMPPDRNEMWRAFAGTGGEFWLSAALLVLFFVQLPEKFRWGFCRYVFAFFGASSFLRIWFFWRKVVHFEEVVPLGSMVNGEDDGNGDMNVLIDHGWRERAITLAYDRTGWVCLGVVVAVWLVFATRLDRRIGAGVARLLPEAWRE